MSLPTITVDGVTYEVENDPFGEEVRYDMSSPGARCPEDGRMLAEHVCGQPCTPAKACKATSIFALPIARWAWQGDAAALRA